MSGFTGIKLKFSDTGEAKIIHGEKIMPHVTDLIQERLNKKDLAGLEDIFYNFNVPGYQTGLTRELVLKEAEQYEQFLYLTEKIVAFPGLDSGFAPEAA